MNMFQWQYGKIQAIPKYRQYQNTGNTKIQAIPKYRQYQNIWQTIKRVLMILYKHVVS